MKVHNTAVFVGDTSKSERHGTKQAEQRKNGKTIFAGDLKQKLDPIAEKKKQARKQAMKIVGDTWAADRKIDNDLDDRRSKIACLKQENEQDIKAMQEIQAQKESLAELYGVDPNSQEAQDLRLLEKEADAANPNKNVSLTEEETERLKQIRQNGLTEYQSRALEMKHNADHYEGEIHARSEEIRKESSVIRETRLERLKSDPMVGAQREAEELLEAAGKEIIGMLMNEAKDHMDEEFKEKIEEAKEKAEEKKEQEEKLESIKEKKEEQEEMSEDIADSTQDILEATEKQSDIQKELKDIMDKMNLLSEDLKGAAVDENA